MNSSRLYGSHWCPDYPRFSTTPTSMTSFRSRANDDYQVFQRDISLIASPSLHRIRIRSILHHTVQHPHPPSHSLQPTHPPPPHTHHGLRRIQPPRRRRRHKRHRQTLLHATLQHAQQQTHPLHRTLRNAPRARARPRPRRNTTTPTTRSPSRFKARLRRSQRYAHAA